MDEGLKDIEIGFSYYHYSDEHFNTAELSLFEVQGSQYASHYCKVCKNGFSPEGSESCNFC